MAQFDVHRSPNRARTSTPYLLVIQRERYDSTPYRVTVPLILSSEFRHLDRHLNPAFTIEDKQVVMDPLNIVTLPVKVLGAPIDNLAKQAMAIVRAIDELIAQSTN
jgi:toxin CcdB